MSQSFLDGVRFPVDISYGSSGGPRFFNSVAASQNGTRKVNVRREQPVYVYNVAKGVQSQSQLDELHRLFLVCRGNARGFRYKDWADYRAVSGEGILKPAGDGTHQLYKRYDLGGGEVFDRLIQKPVQGTVAFSGGSGTLDYATGLVSNCTATGWTGEFDVPVVFQGEEFSADISTFETYDTVVQLESVPV